MIDAAAMTAADIMTANVVTVGPDTSVGVIAALLLDHEISAVPVIDGERHVLGIVSEGDLLGHPPAGSPRRRWLRLFDRESVSLEEIATAQHKKARDVMTHPAVTVVDRTPVDVLATLMHRRRLKRVPVLRDGRLAGIVSRSDVLAALVRGHLPDRERR
jgi:CBS-domain-containing membrane protein